MNKHQITNSKSKSSITRVLVNSEIITILLLVKAVSMKKLQVFLSVISYLYKSKIREIYCSNTSSIYFAYNFIIMFTNSKV